MYTIYLLCQSIFTLLTSFSHFYKHQGFLHLLVNLQYHRADCNFSTSGLNAKSKSTERNDPDRFK